MLSYGDGERTRVTRTSLSVRLIGPASVTPGSEECFLLLLVEPAKELLESRIVLNLFDRVEFVAQFVMRPRLVDEVLT